MTLVPRDSRFYLFKWHLAEFSLFAVFVLFVSEMGSHYTPGYLATLCIGQAGL